MNIGQRIKKKRKELHLSADDLAVRLNKDRSTIYRYEKGDIENLPLDILEPIAKVLQTTPQYLMGWEDDSEVVLYPSEARPITLRRFPLLGNVACGEPIFAEEDHDAYISADSDIDADFCLTAKGDSMINARIFDGDILFVKSQSIVNDGEIAVVLIEDEATVKRVYYDRENGIITLVPENPMYKPMRYSGKQLDQIRIIGKVISGQYNITGS